MVDQSQALKSARAASTLGGQDIEFDFDDQIISSNAYRRAFRSFVQRPQPQKDETKQSEDLNDEATLFRESAVATSITHEESSGNEAPPNATGLARQSPSGGKERTTRGDGSGDEGVTASEVESKPQSRPQSKTQPLLSAQGHHSIPPALPPAAPIATIPTVQPQAKIPGPVEELNAMLRKAAEKGHVSLDVPDKDNNRAIHYATQNGRAKVVELLLQKGVELESKGLHKNRPLNLACISGDLEIVKALLDGGADIEGEGCLGWHPLVRDFYSACLI
jgi:hypothetical protein